MDKIGIEQLEKKIESEKIDSSSDRIPVEEVDNYHGLDVKTVLVYLAVNLILFAQISNLVGSGAYARNITAVVGGSNRATWFVSIISIFGSCGGLPVSQCADYWGRKWFLVVTTVCGFTGCIIVSRANSFHMVIAGSIISSVSYVAMPLLYAVSSEILPRKYRPLAQGGVNATSGLAAIASLLIGTTMMKTNSNGFRSFWYMLAAFFGVSAAICAVLYNPPPRDLQISLTPKEKLSRLDWVGYALITSGLVLFNIGLSWSDNPYSWHNVHILAPFVVGVVLLIALVIHQTIFKHDGMFDHRLFSGRTFAVALICFALEGMLFYAANSYFFFEVAVLYDSDLFRVGIRFCINFIVAICCSVLVGAYVSKYKKLRVPTVLGFTSFMIFMILMTTLTLDTGKNMWGYPIVLGLGLGTCVTTIITSGQLSAPPDMIATASGLMISTRFLGGAIALTIYNAVFNSKLQNNIGPEIAGAVLPLGLNVSSLPEFITALATNNATELLTITGVTPEIAQAGGHALLQTYLISFRYVWIISAVFSACGAISAMFLLEPLTLTMHTDAPLATTKDEIS